MKSLVRYLHAIAYCASTAIIGGCVGAVAGVGIAGLLMRPEEAVVLVTGVTLGGPGGALMGLSLAAFDLARRSPTNEQ
jgi:hypothetical protein